MQSCVSSSGRHSSDVVAITALRKPLSLSTRFSLRGSVFDDCFAMTSLAVKVLHSYYAARGFTLTERRQPEGSNEFKAMFADLDKIHWSVMSELQQTARDPSIKTTFVATTFTQEQSTGVEAVQEDPSQNQPEAVASRYSLCESRSKLMGGKVGCDPLHFSPEIFKPGSPYVVLWENKFFGSMMALCKCIST